MLSAVRRLLSPPWLYGLLYLAAIPGYAAAYVSVGDQFHHSTSRYEREIADDASSLLERLHSELVRSYINNNGTSQLFVYEGLEIGSRRFSGVYETDVRTLTLISIESRDRTIIVSLHGTLDIVKPTPRSPETIGFTVTVAIPVERFARVMGTDEVSVALHQVRVVRNPVNFPLRALFSTRPPGAELRENTFLVPLSIELSQRLHAFWSATKGFPSAVGGSYWRMLYLSAITITTLGYGDIVPIGDAARWLVGSEAVAGIILIGLFLNSIVQRRSDPGRV